MLIGTDGTDAAIKVIEGVISCAAEYSDRVFDEPFTYGMTQKWVNMYFKYLWLFSRVVESGTNLGIPTDLDMPIDSFIIDALFEEKILSETICNDPANTALNGLINTKSKKINANNRASESVSKWSGWNSEVYKAVQERIKVKVKSDDKYKHILEYENKLWIDKI